MNNTFEEKIAECINEKLNDGTVERLINEKLEQGISKALDDALGYGGSAKKMITSKIEEALVPAIEQHDFNQYLVKLDSILTEIINNTSIKDNKAILDNFKYLMKDNVDSFGIIPISKVYEEYQNYVSENIDTSELEIDYDDSPSYCNALTSMEVEKCERSWFGSDVYDYIVKFTCEEDENMNCEFRLNQYKGEKIHISESEIPIDIHSLRTLSKFEIFIQKMKQNWTEIKLDKMDSFEDDVEIEAEPECDWS